MVHDDRSIPTSRYSLYTGTQRMQLCSKPCFQPTLRTRQPPIRILSLSRALGQCRLPPANLPLGQLALIHRLCSAGRQFYGISFFTVPFDGNIATIHRGFQGFTTQLPIIYTYRPPISTGCLTVSHTSHYIPQPSLVLQEESTGQ